LIAQNVPLFDDNFLDFRNQSFYSVDDLMRKLVFLIAEFERCYDRMTDFQTKPINQWVILSYNTKYSIEAKNC
jgi:hypothetical protein